MSDSTTTAAAAAPSAGTLLADAAPVAQPAEAGAPAVDAAPKNGADDAPAGADATAETNPEAGDRPPDKPPERAAPEAYDIKAPDGVTLDAEAAAEFEAVARELNMPQDEAQALVQRMAPKLQQRFAAQQTELMARASSEWAESAKADKEIGGDALPESMAAAKRALKHLGTPELASVLEDSHLGNHPEVLRFMARAGKALGPDGTFLGGRAATNVNAAQSIYAKSNMNP